MSKFKIVQDAAIEYNAPYIEGLASPSDRIELQHHCWLIDEYGETVDLIWGNNFPFPVYIGIEATPNGDGEPVFTEEYLHEALQITPGSPGGSDFDDDEEWE